MTLVITALSGEHLRHYAEINAGNKLIAVFPEHGLSPQEQAAFLVYEGHRYTEVITFSPFIISDAAELKILEGDTGITQGDSVKTILMKLGQEKSIGHVVAGKLDKAAMLIEKSESLAELNEINDEIEQLGNSEEVIILLNISYRKYNQLLSGEA